MPIVLLLPREIFVDKVKGDSVVLLYSMYGDNDQLWNIIIMRCVLGSFKFSIAYYRAASILLIASYYTYQGPTLTHAMLI